jgi:hypothetical protein
MAKNKLYKSEVNEAEPSSYSPALAYELEHKESTLELQGYQEPVEM